VVMCQAFLKISGVKWLCDSYPLVTLTGGHPPTATRRRRMYAFPRRASYGGVLRDAASPCRHTTRAFVVSRGGGCGVAVSRGARDRYQRACITGR